MAFLGFGSCFGGTILVYIMKWYGEPKTKADCRKERIGISFYHFALTALCFTIFIYTNSQEYQGLTSEKKVLLCSLGFTWGLMDSAINNEIQLVLSKEFEDHIGAFGVFKLV
jgi:hypothetical protein